jgi:hypothetical protein
MGRVVGRAVKKKKKKKRNAAAIMNTVIRPVPCSQGGIDCEWRCSGRTASALEWHTQAPTFAASKQGVGYECVSGNRGMQLKGIWTWEFCMRACP